MTLRFPAPEAAVQGQELLRGFCRTLRVSGNELFCYVNSAAEITTRVIRTLDQAGLSLDGLTMSRPTLDDVFLKTTGARLAANPADQEPLAGAAVRASAAVSAARGGAK
jgi:hypothetical protein